MQASLNLLTNNVFYTVSKIDRRTLTFILKALTGKRSTCKSVTRGTQEASRLSEVDCRRNDGLHVNRRGSEENSQPATGRRRRGGPRRAAAHGGRHGAAGPEGGKNKRER